METAVDEHLAFALVAVVAAAVIAPLMSDRLGRWVLIPSVVIEIVLGVVIGPAVLGLVEPGPVLEALAQVGMAVLFFLAGYEIELRRVAGRTAGLAVAGWVVSFALAVTAAAVAGAGDAVWIVAIGLSSTALGTVLPIARDARLLSGPVGPRLMAVGAVGEFAPIVLLALLFSAGARSGAVTVEILVAGVAVGAAVFGSMRRSRRISRLLSATLGTSIQFAIRLSVLALLAAVLLAAEVGVDIALGAFAAGMVMRSVLAAIEDAEAEIVRSKLDAIGFGCFIPVFFVYTGVTFELDALLGSGPALALVPVFVAGFALVRGAVTWVLFRREVPRSQLRALSWLAAVELPIVVVAAGVGADRGLITPSVQAAMVGAAMVSVLVFPLLALRAGRIQATGTEAAASARS